MDHPSAMVLDQRIRNRTIEYLEVPSSFEKQVAYASHGIGNVPNEMINQWEDWVHGDIADYGEPVYSAEERAAMQAYQPVWLAVCDTLTDPFPDLTTLMTTEPWERLRRAAKETLQVCNRRGRFDEERETFDA
jgi:hypothetical protein